MIEKLYLDTPISPTNPLIIYFKGKRYAIRPNKEWNCIDIANYVKTNFYDVYDCEVYCDDYGVTKGLFDTLANMGINVKRTEWTYMRVDFEGATSC